MFDEIKFNHNNNEYIENNKEVYFDFFSKFIKGSSEYNDEIDKLFFDDLIKANLCSKENITENKINIKYLIYSCINNKYIKEKIKNFPSLSFNIKIDNLIFTFTYEDLFKIFNNKYFFMIIFPKDNNIERLNRWFIGEIFLSKYIPTFHLEKKTISFYSNNS